MGVGLNLEMSCLLIAMILLAGMAIVLLTRIAEKVTRVSYFVWAVICTCLLLPTVLSVFDQLRGRGEYGQSFVFLLWAFLLGCFGFVAVRYGRKYKKQILGTYAGITFIVTVLCFLGQPVGQIAAGTELAAHRSPLLMLSLLFLLAGNTAMAVLASLTIVAEKRPIKVKRWIRFSYLFAGLGLFFGCIWSYRSLLEGCIWSWKTEENVILIPWLILSAYLHGKKSYTKAICILPFSLTVLGMAAIRGLPFGERLYPVYETGNSSLAVWGVLAFLLLAVGGAAVLLRKEVIRQRNVSIKDTMQLFRLLTYGYAALLFFVTAVQAVTRVTTFTGFYTMLTALYVVALTALFLWNLERMEQLKYVAVVIWNTLLTIGVIFLFPKLNTLCLVLFWICLFPVTFFLFQYKTAWKTPYRISHLFLSVAILGIIASCGFSVDTAEVCSKEQDVIRIHGERINAERIQTGQTLILHRPSGDYVVTESETGAAGENAMIVGYSSRPLIYLFWIGGAGLFVCIVWEMARRN